VTNAETVFRLSHESVPTHWYNILADFRAEIPRPQLPRAAAADARRSAIRPQLPLTMFRQSRSRTRFIEIPEPVRQEYQRWRPTPLYRARRLESALNTAAHIYFKHEGTSPSGSHKLNTALPQAYYYAQAGVRELVTGTGAGQWGTALSMACRPYGLACTVFMVRCSYEQKPFRGLIVSPSTKTEVGRAALRADPDTPGSLAIANAEAIEYANARPDARFSLGSGENHVLMHQTVIGEEALLQMELAGEFPDVVIGAVGAGSNFAGISFPFYREALCHRHMVRFVAVEADACPKMTRGSYRMDHTDYSAITPMVKMYTLGHRFSSYHIHAGGLRFHGAAPIVSAMYHQGKMEARSYPQSRVFESGVLFAQTEGIIPAPESAHAVACAIDEALSCLERSSGRTILFSLSGHGLLDLSAYESFLSGDIVDYSPSDDDIRDSLSEIRP
jgi:tryptophan synthase beta chain